MSESQEPSHISKGLQKLCEILKSCYGFVRDKYIAFDRKALIGHAEAKSEELDVLSEAVARNRSSVDEIRYSKAGGWELIASNRNVLPEGRSALSISERAQLRISSQAIRAQENIEAITVEAANILSDKETVSDAPVDIDWINRFFKTVEDISNGKMQLLWGKLLAGEIERPGTFSVRTLEVLKNMAQKDAELFGKIAKFAFTSKDSSIAFVINDMDYYDKKSGISFNDFITLTEVGLFCDAGVFSELDSISWTFTVDNPAISNVLRFGDYGVLLEFSEPQQNIKINILSLTSAGQELLSLIKQEPNEDYFRLFARKVKEKAPHLKTLGYALWSPSGNSCIKPVTPVKIE